MLKVGLIGLGFMGRVHLENYIRLEAEGFPVKLVALCDVDEEKFMGKWLGGNLDTGKGELDLKKYALYSDLDEMLEKEQLDYLDVTLPTYLHAEASIKALNKGLHVLCEKPMALNPGECLAMIEAARQNGKKLMIGQCLRFWPEYEYLKECVENSCYGKVVSGYFFRGGTTPIWSYKNWLLQAEKSGGCLLDQHIHDVDMINWLFGKPLKVSSIARNIVPGSGYDAVSTNYIYEDGKVVNAQDDWTLNGEYGFSMVFRVNFEKGNLVFDSNGLKVNPNDSKAFIPELPKEMGYYREIQYFVKAVLEGTPITTAAPESTMETIRIAEAEVASAGQMGMLVAVE
jgi:predicted dehydrogenase